jgi:hypothetical protein
MVHEVGRAKGGNARAKNLPASRRSEIAATAARARWEGEQNTVVCGSADSPLRIGGVEIECYVLSDGTRVLTQASFLEAIGRHRRANIRRSDDPNRLPPILAGKAIAPFVSAEVAGESKPISFRLPGGTRASGYRAELLPTVCEVYLSADEAGVLPANQKHIAKQAGILVRGLAHTGIIALVDEATGYQEVRARDALAKILESFIDKELQPYIQTFPADYYKEMFRLRGLDFRRDTVRRPQYFGTLTNDVVYKRLAPGVLDELKKVQRRDDKGRARDRLFQRLTTNVGYPKLREHLGSVVTLMKLSTDWTDFKLKLDQIHPRVGETYGLPLVIEQVETDDGIGL